LPSANQNIGPNFTPSIGSQKPGSIVAVDGAAVAGLDDLAAAHACLSRLSVNDAGVVMHPGEAPAADRFARSG